jgi:hypothetical protein
MNAHSSLLTEKQVAQMANCSPRHVVNLRLRGQLSFVKLGRLVRYRPSDVERCLDRMTIKEIA